MPSKEHPGLISFRMDWLDLLAVQGTLKSLLQQVTIEYAYFRELLVTMEYVYTLMTSSIKFYLEKKCLDK